jgi:hypothetical protein
MTPIKGYEGLFVITDDLKIISLPRKGTLGGEIKPFLNIENGYYRVSLTKNNRRKKTMLHRIIAEHFIPNPHNYPHVDHINGIKTDNRIENLRWCTRLQNMLFDNHRQRRNKKTDLKGVSYNTINKKYGSEVKFDGYRKWLGYFDTKEQAREVYLAEYDKWYKKQIL